MFLRKANSVSTPIPLPASSLLNTLAARSWWQICGFLDAVGRTQIVQPTQEFNGGAITLNVEGLASGIYILHISNGAGIMDQLKFVKK